MYRQDKKMYAFIRFLVCFIWFTNFLPENAVAYTYENITQLKTLLLTGYDPDVIPLSNQTHSLQVNIGMTLFQILEVDTVTGVLKTTMGLDCSWFDERIKWVPGDHGGITSLMILSKNVWTPPLAPGQPVEFSAFGESWMHVTYTFNGEAFWRPGGVKKHTCHMNMKYWPFDKQTCEITFFPYDYWNGEILFNVSEVVTEYYTENSEWTLEHTTATIDDSLKFQHAIFMITIERRPMFYMLTLTMPLIGLGLMTLFVFLLPSESGERVGFAITTLLALTVFLTNTFDNIPKSSDPVPLMCVFLFTGVFVSLFATIIVILNVAIYHRSSDKKIGTWYVTLVKLTRRRPNKVKDIKIVEGAEKHERDNRYRPDLTEDTTRGTIETDTKKMAGKGSGYSLNIQDHNDLDITWKDVSSAIDHVRLFHDDSGRSTNCSRVACGE